MKYKILLVLGTMTMFFIGGQNAAAQVIEKNPNPQYILPDLAFGKILKRSVSSIELLVVNQGKAKSASTEGSFNCISIEAENGVKLGFGVLLWIKELSPGASFKVLMDCGAGKRITGAGLDGKNKVKESNEKNNSMAF